MHVIEVNTQIEGWRFERCVCGFTLVTSAAGRRYWLRAHGEPRSLTDDAGRLAALNHECWYNDPTERPAPDAGGKPLAVREREKREAYAARRIKPAAAKHKKPAPAAPAPAAAKAQVFVRKKGVRATVG